jgi:hypothetical protein
MVDIPFVSEDFQRAFRNQFPAQTSTGRDLHVSDVVIPVVDFTPTASGASLPESLRFARNGNTTTAYSSGNVGYTDIISTPGFFGLDWNFSVSLGSADIYIRLAGATNVDIMNQNIILPTGFGNHTNMNDQMKVYVPAGYTVQWSTAISAGATLNANLFITPLADVNGNLLNPFNYNPQ